MKKTALKLLTVTTLFSSLIFSPTLSYASETTDVSKIPRNDPTLNDEMIKPNLVKEIPSSNFIKQNEGVSEINLEFDEILETIKNQNNKNSKILENTLNQNSITLENKLNNEYKPYDYEYENNDSSEEATILSYSRYYPTYVSAVLDNTGKEFDVDFYKFSTVSSNGDLAVTLEVPSGYDYDLWVIKENGTGWASMRGTSQNEIVKIPAPQSGIETFYIVVLPYIDFETGYVSPSNPKEWYRLKIDQLWDNDKQTVNVSPSTLTNPGAGYSNTGSVDLTRVASIPNTAQVTDVRVLGSLSKDLGNTYVLVANTDSLEWRSGYLRSSVNSHYIPGFDNSYDKVKSIWYVEYFTAAYSSSTFKNVQLQISYRYDQYENY